MIEAILTFFLVWVVFATAADPRGSFTSIAGLAIGLTITLDILFGGPLTGAAMNPSRAFGPELVDGDWADAWVWYLGPLLGGAVAALAYERLYLRPLARSGRAARDGSRGAPSGRRGVALEAAARARARSRLREPAGRDRVPDRILPVGDVEPGRGERSRRRARTRR